MQPNFPRRGWSDRPPSPFNRPGHRFRPQGPPRFNPPAHPPARGLHRGRGQHHLSDSRGDHGMRFDAPNGAGRLYDHSGNLGRGLNDPGNYSVRGEHPSSSNQYASPPTHGAQETHRGRGQPVHQSGWGQDGRPPVEPSNNNDNQIRPLMGGTPQWGVDTGPSNALRATPGYAKPDSSQNVHLIRPLIGRQSQDGVTTGSSNAPPAIPKYAKPNDSKSVQLIPHLMGKQPLQGAVAGSSNPAPLFPNHGKPGNRESVHQLRPLMEQQRSQSAGDTGPSSATRDRDRDKTSSHAQREQGLIVTGDTQLSVASDRTAGTSRSRKLQEDESRSRQDKSVLRGCEDSVASGPSGSGDSVTTKANTRSQERGQTLITIATGSSPGVGQSSPEVGGDIRTESNRDNEDPKAGVRQKKTSDTASKTDGREDKSRRRESKSVRSSESSRSEEHSSSRKSKEQRSNSPDKGERRSDDGDQRPHPRDSGDQSQSDRRDRDYPGSGSRDRQDQSSYSSRKSSEASDRSRRDRQSSSRDVRDTRSSDSRDRKNAFSGSRDRRRDQSSGPPRDKRSSSVSYRAERSSSRDPRDKRSSSTMRDRTPPRRSRSRSPVGDRSSKRPRSTASSREGGTVREIDMRRHEASRQSEAGRSEVRRRKMTTLIDELGGESDDTIGEWGPTEEAAERERVAETLLAAIMSTSGASGEEEKKNTEKKKVTRRWIQSSAKENYYTSNPAEIMEGSTVAATQNLKDMLGKFKTTILDVYAKAKAEQPEFEITFKERHHHHRGCNHSDGSSSDSSSDSAGSDEEEDETTEAIRVLRQKEKHPSRLGQNLWYNDEGQLNDRHVCRCSLKARKSGIRHNFFPGEVPYPLCDPLGNNLRRLHHYTIQISPCTNFIFRYPTVITHDGQEFFFEGLSLFSHAPLEDIPPCTVIRFGLEYTLTLVEEPPPENFTVQELDYFSDYIFTEILELYDFDYYDRSGEGCRRFHFMPRFGRLLAENGKEILSMHRVMLYLINIRKPVMTGEQLPEMLKFENVQWSRFLRFMNDMIVSCPGKKPSSVRVDQVDRDLAVCTEEKKVFPVIVHAGVMPTHLTYAANPRYKKLYKSFLRMRHLFKNRSHVANDEQQAFIKVQNELAKIKRNSATNLEATSELDCGTMTITGIRTDVCQHALIIPVIVQYLRYHVCLDKLNENLGSIFTDKILLKRAMTHPSHRLTFGMNSDHIRNSLYNCALRSPEFGNKHWQQSNENRKKGIVNLVKIMSRLAEEEEVLSNIHHYERLEFLGDAVVEFITSTALYHLFPNLEEGGLAVYRQALVENHHLAKIAKKMELEHFMLYSHGPDLCRCKDLDHAVANCFEALMGAIFLERGIDEARRIFCTAVFDEEDLRYIWIQYPKHPLQQQCPDGDRHMIEEFPILQRMTEFEERTGMTFKNIRLLARAFTQRTMSYNDLTLGHNQRMEFLGDSVLQLVVSAYLFKHFPEHHEGHLSLLRSSLVNNNTQSIICQDLGLEEFMIDIDANRFRKVSTKLRADILEALIGAIYVDRGLDLVETFINVCFFPRLREFIIEQDWNDDKSKLQQVVLTLRKEGAENPDVPHYKLLKESGPANAKIYTVAVFFKERKIGVGSAMSIRMAEKEAARDALSKGQYKQIKFQTKLMSSLYPEEFKPPEVQNPRKRQRKPPMPKQYALPSTRNRREKR